MKLYVWVNPYHIPWGLSIVYAIAASEDEARALAANSPVFAYGDYHERDLRGQALGPPTRIVDLPCAECYEWEE